MHFIEFVMSYAFKYYLTAFLKDEGLVVSGNFQVISDEKDWFKVISSVQESHSLEKLNYIEKLLEVLNGTHVTAAAPVCLMIHADLSKFGQLFKGLMNLKGCVQKLMKEYRSLNVEIKREYLHIMMMRNSEMYWGKSFKTSQDLHYKMKATLDYILDLLHESDNTEKIIKFDEILDDLLEPDNVDIIQCRIQVPEPHIVDDKDVFKCNIESIAKGLYNMKKTSTDPTWSSLGKLQDHYRKAAEIKYLKTFLPLYNRSGILAILILQNELDGHRIKSASKLNLELSENDTAAFLSLDENNRRSLLLQSVMICDVVENYGDDDSIEERARKLMYRWLNRYNSNDNRGLRAEEANKCINVGVRWIELGVKVRHMSELDVNYVQNILFGNFNKKKSILAQFEFFALLVKNNNTEEAKNLLDKMYDVNSSDYPLGFSPLFWAVYYGNQELVEVIIEKHPEEIQNKDCINHTLPPDLKLIHDEPWTPLMWACALGHTSIVEILLKNFTDYSQYEKLLSLVVLSCDFNSLITLHSWCKLMKCDRIADGANIWTPLHYFCSRLDWGPNDLDLLKSQTEMLPSCLPFDLYDCAYQGYKPIHIAIYSRRMQVFQELLRYKELEKDLWEDLEIYVHGMSLQGAVLVTPLYVAARRGYPEFVREILNRSLIESIDSEPDSESSRLRNYSLHKSYMLLSEEKALNPDVLWELITFENDDYHLSNYRSQILNRLDLLELQYFYDKYISTVEPVLVRRCKEHVSPGKYFINHEGVPYETTNLTFTPLEIREVTPIKDIHPFNFKFTISPSSVVDSRGNGGSMRRAFLVDIYRLYRITRFHFLSSFQILCGVSEYTINIPNTASLWFISDVVLNIDGHLGSDVLQLNFVKASIQCAWEKYGLSYHCFDMVIYTGYMIYYGYYNYTFYTQSIYEREMLTWATIAFSSCLMIYLLAKIVTHVRRKSWYVVQLYLSHYHTWAELSSLVLAFYACLIRIKHQFEETDDSANMMAFATLLVYIKIMHILSPFESTGPLIGMIETIIWGIKYYLMIIFVVVVAFALSLYIVSYVAIDQDTGEFSDRGNGLLSVYNNMLGNTNFNPTGVTNSTVANAIIILIVLVAAIILLNLLISIMGGLYSKVSIEAESEWRRKVCKTVIMQPHWFNKCSIESFTFIRRDMDVHKEQTTTKSTQKEYNDKKYEYTLFQCHLNDSNNLFQPTNNQEVRIISNNEDMLKTFMNVSRNTTLYSPPPKTDDDLCDSTLDQIHRNSIALREETPFEDNMMRKSTASLA